MPSTSNNNTNKKLSVDTELPPVTSTACSTSSTSTTSTTSIASTASTTTPQKQPIMTDSQRTAKAIAFVEGLGLNWPELNAESKVHVKSLMSKDFTWSPTRGDQDGNCYHTIFQDEWSEFCDSLPNGHQVWKDDNPPVFFDKTAITDYLVIRRQITRTCSLHASVVYQHYLHCLRSGSPNHTMMDISNYIRDNLEPEKQKHYVENGSCKFASQDFFCMIIGQPRWALDVVQISEKSKSKFFQEDADMVVKKFKELNEPALVSCFLIEADFHNTKKCVFDYEVEENKFKEYANQRGGSITQHAMVMLGAYKEEATGKVWFLLQNFWKGAYFRLVSAEYMASCRGQISFLFDKGAAVSLKQEFAIVNAEYAESAVSFEECASYHEDEED